MSNCFHPDVADRLILVVAINEVEGFIENGYGDFW